MASSESEGDMGEPDDAASVMSGDGSDVAAGQVDDAEHGAVDQDASAESELITASVSGE